MSLHEVIVENQTETSIWVIIAENANHVVETRSRTVGDYEFEAYYKLMVEGKAALPIEGVPIEVGGSHSQEFKTRLKTYWEENKEFRFEWSGFIEAGELEIAANSRNRWALKGDELPYYISVRTMGGRILANAVARDDATITIDPTGHIADPVPVRVPIVAGAVVYLQRSGGGTFIGDPKTANNGWDAGTCGPTGGSHNLVPISGALEAGTHLRIVSSSATLAAADFKYAYSSDIGWIYYDKHRADSANAGRKQLWKLSKTSNDDNSPGATLHYGDQVVISNARWPKANLGVKDTWLQCVNNDPSVWVLRAEPRV